MNRSLVRIFKKYGLLASLLFSPSLFAGLGEVAQLVLIAETTAQQLETQISQFNQIQERLNHYPNTTINQDLDQLLNAMKQGEALAVTSSNLNNQFKNTFTGFEQAADFDNAYKHWSQTTRDSLLASLNVANLQSSQMKNEEAVFSQLKEMAKKPEGQMQALQIGSQIALEQTAQMQKLRTLVMAQLQAQNAYMAEQQQLRDNQKAAEKNFFTYKKVTQSHYKSY